MKEKIAFASAISEQIRDIFGYPLNIELTISEYMEEFFDVMREWDIRKNTPSEDGKGFVGTNHEWTMFEMYFYEVFKDSIEYHYMMPANLPNDLYSY